MKKHSVCRFLKKICRIWDPKMSIFKIRGTHKTHFFRNFIFLSAKKSVPTQFLKSIFFMSTSIYSDKLLDLFWVKTGKIAFFTRKSGSDSKTKCTNPFSGKKYIKICTLDMWKNFFGEAVRQLSSCSKWKKAIKIHHQTKIDCSAHKKNTFQNNFAQTSFFITKYL